MRHERGAVHTPAATGRTFSVAGDVITILLSGEDTGGAYMQCELVAPPGKGPPPHMHAREDEAFYILEGEAEFHVDGRIVRGRRGDAVLAPKGSRHFFRNVGDGSLRLVITCSPAGFEGFIAEAGDEVAAGSEPLPFDEARLQRLLAAAARHGIEILAQPEAV